MLIISAGKIRSCFIWFYVTTAIRFMFCNYTYNMLLNYCAIRFMFCNYTYNMAQIYHLNFLRLREIGRSFLHNNAFVVFFANCLDRYGNVFYGQYYIYYIVLEIDLQASRLKNRTYVNYKENN
ncbi:hypothetical protein ACJX0J_032010 [Zea mays]